MGRGAQQATKSPCSGCRAWVAALLAAAQCVGRAGASRNPVRSLLLELEAHVGPGINVSSAHSTPRDGHASDKVFNPKPLYNSMPGTDPDWVGLSPHKLMEEEQALPAHQHLEDLTKVVDHRRFHGFGGWLSPTAWEVLLNVGSGTGAAPGSTGDLMLDQDLMRRMRFQDKVVMVLLLVAYAGSLAFSANLAYRQSLNNSPITYYADPRFYTQVSESHDLEDFLDAFNCPPKEVQLQITGFTPMPPLHDSFVDAAVDWLGSRYRIAFSFALDLSPWVVHDDREGVGSSAGISAEDTQRLRNFLQQDANDLAAVQIQKEVRWSDWEELATNIKHQIRQNGFHGIIHVCCAEDEVMTIYKNKTWANFMHRRATKVLCALSLVGWIIYQPYMWLRHQALVVTSHYRVDVAISSYWPLIRDKVGPDGFNSNAQ
mmetsp:Transcript_107936/g.344078  ORF Transcript_107936/g.344078 Transcript_107936/m.344078 type:complete len:429 (+) Transcript_107936:59-1345(+)